MRCLIQCLLTQQVFAWAKISARYILGKKKSYSRLTKLSGLDHSSILVPSSLSVWRDISDSTKIHDIPVFHKLESRAFDLCLLFQILAWNEDSFQYSWDLLDVNHFIFFHFQMLAHQLIDGVKWSDNEPHSPTWQCWKWLLDLLSLLVAKPLKIPSVEPVVWPHVRKFYRALGIIRLHIFKLSSGSSEKWTFMTKLQEQPQQMLGDFHPVPTKENGWYSPISVVVGISLQARLLFR